MQSINETLSNALYNSRSSEDKITAVTDSLSKNECKCRWCLRFNSNVRNYTPGKLPTDERTSEIYVLIPRYMQPSFMTILIYADDVVDKS